MKDIIIIGGGLSGLINAILLAKAGLEVLLIEKKQYPFHRVCGEYVSKEVIPFLRQHHLFPDHLQPGNISRFQLTSIKGQSTEIPLDMGAFTISRYEFDYFLYQKAVELGVVVLEKTTVTQVNYQEDYFQVNCRDGRQFEGNIVIGAYGKRSVLDRKLNRKFFTSSSPYIGVKYHVRTDFPDDLVALHNFKDGYCGVNKIEDGKTNICYLSHRKNLKMSNSILDMEQHILHQNPHIKALWEQSEFLYEKPLVINEISFATKTAIEQHILMCGDAAGMITPLCGNGMAIAIRSAHICATTILEHYTAKHFNRVQLEATYVKRWKKQFENRLWVGRNIQSLFGGEKISEVAVGLAKNVRPVAKYLMKQTHGASMDHTST